MTPNTPEDISAFLVRINLVYAEKVQLQRRVAELEAEVKQSNKAEAEARDGYEKMIAERNFLQADIDALQSRITELEAEREKWKAGNKLLYDTAMEQNHEFGLTMQFANELIEKKRRITELEKLAVVWHKYPDEKPERPVGFTGMWLNVLTIDECGCTWIGTCRFIGNELDMLAPQTTKYWAYLPEPPKEEK